MPEEAVRKSHQCAICGRRFKKGGAKYRLNLEVISDFDGYLSVPINKQQDFQEQLKKILEQLQQKSPTELEEEVYVKMERMICPNCRETILNLFRSSGSD